MGVSKEILKKIDFYEQYYFSLDKPVPIKDNLMCYPILVKDYYKFYNCLGCITMDKNVKKIQDKNTGMVKTVSNLKGLRMNYFEFLIDSIINEPEGQLLGAQFLELLEMAFHVTKGMYCPKCEKEISYTDVLKGQKEYVDEVVERTRNLYEKSLQEEEKNGKIIEDREMPKDLLEKIIFIEAETTTKKFNNEENVNCHQ